MNWNFTNLKDFLKQSSWDVLIIIKVKHNFVDHFELVHVLKLLYFPKISCERQHFDNLFWVDKIIFRPS